MLNILKQLKIATLSLIFLTVLTGFIYPLFITVISQQLFSWRANGSLIQQNGVIKGSALIGQAFTDPRYFWSRPSATSPLPYNAASSSGSNLGPTNPTLIEAVKKRIALLRQADPQNNAAIPVDLVTASGSGLDPEISPRAADYQIPRVAKARGLSEQQLKQLVQRFTKKREFLFLGEPRVNVLLLNLALDQLTAKNKS